MAIRVILIVLTLTGCSAYPQVNWPMDLAGPAPALLPMDELQSNASDTLDSRGAALAADAAALRVRAAAIGG